MLMLAGTQSNASHGDLNRLGGSYKEEDSLRVGSQPFQRGKGKLSTLNYASRETGSPHNVLKENTLGRFGGFSWNKGKSYLSQILHQLQPPKQGCSFLFQRGKGQRGFRGGQKSPQSLRNTLLGVLKINLENTHTQEWYGLKGIDVDVDTSLFF